MSLSVRTRFEVLKRDRFTCRYCGRHTPDVLLEVDHVVPRAAGGSDDIDNLVTACWDCNHGKADRLLEEGSAPVSRSMVDETAERVAQAQAYAELMAAERVLHERFVGMVIDEWAKGFGAHMEEESDGTYWRFDTRWEQWPDQSTIRRFVRRLPVADVLDAVDETSARFRNGSSEHACRYFYAICWRRIKEPRE